MLHHGEMREVEQITVRHTMVAAPRGDEREVEQITVRRIVKARHTMIAAPRGDEGGRRLEGSLRLDTR